MEASDSDSGPAAPPSRATHRCPQPASSRSPAITALAAGACHAQNCGWAHRPRSELRRIRDLEPDRVSQHRERPDAGAARRRAVGGLGHPLRQDRCGRAWDSQIIEAHRRGRQVHLHAARASQGNNPCLWFQGPRTSFPSGEATSAAALVTPYVLEYAHDDHFGLRPAAAAVRRRGRIKNQAHWQTDVLTGWAIGGLSGWSAHEQETPLLIRILLRIRVGLKASFWCGVHGKAVEPAVLRVAWAGPAG